MDNDLLRRYNSVQKDIDVYRAKAIEYETNVKNCDESIAKSLEAMEKIGTTPEKIAEEYEKLREKAEKDLAKVERDVQKAKEKLNEKGE